MTKWASMIRDLEATKRFTLKSIGDRIGLAPSSVSDLKQGDSKSPRGEAALKLVQLHIAECGTPPPSEPEAASDDPHPQPDLFGSDGAPAQREAA